MVHPGPVFTPTEAEHVKSFNFLNDPCVPLWVTGTSDRGHMFGICAFGLHGVSWCVVYCIV